MQQCIMDTNLKNSLQFMNGIFKHVTTEVKAFQSRMGNIRSFKKQILPTFQGEPTAADTKAADKATKDAKKAKAAKK